MADSRTRIDMSLRRDEVFHGLHTRISAFAMRKVLNHVESFKRRPTTSIGCCTNTFSRQWGLPCAHIYLERRSLGSSLQVEDFHAQWQLNLGRQLDPIDPLLLIKDPVKIRSRFTSSQKGRERSLVEIVRAEGSSKPSHSVDSRRITQPTDALFPTRHCPASTAVLLHPTNNYDLAPLAYISLGDHLSHGGFRQASEFIN